MSRKSAASAVKDVTLGIFKFGGINVQTKQFIGIALIIIGLLAFVFVMALPHSHYNPEKESSSKKTSAKATKATTPSKSKAKKEKEETVVTAPAPAVAPPTPKSSRKKVAPKADESSPVATAKPRTRASSVKKGKRD